eukprot:363974-Chlamydomonas_euryale.AAC.7
MPHLVSPAHTNALQGHQAAAPPFRGSPFPGATPQRLYTLVGICEYASAHARAGWCPGRLAGRCSWSRVGPTGSALVAPKGGGRALETCMRSCAAAAAAPQRAAHDV